ncbi:hypothetical protein P885DRAFT_42316 [Corynascus similis CBS 632.67]
MAPSASTQAATLERFLDAWKRWDASAWLATFADDFTQVTLPFGMKVPSRDRTQVEQVLPKLMKVVQDYKLTIHEVVHDAAKNKAAIYCMSEGTTPWGPWAMEYAVFIRFTEAGDRVAHLEEMLDSAFMKEFAPKFGQYLREQSVATAAA